MLGRWHQHLRYFYEPSVAMLAWLAGLYVEHPDFRVNFAKLHPDLPEFLNRAILYYCRALRNGA